MKMNDRRGRLLAVAALLALGSLAAGPSDALLAMGRKPTPPSMAHREITRPATAPAGDQIELVDGDYRPVLFVPAAYKPAPDGRVELIVHFHGAPWFAIQEHLRHGLHQPLLVCSFGEGSSVYARPFANDPERFERFLSLVEAELSKRANHPPAKVAQIDFTSFSAGYGAVRELLRQDKITDRVRRVILCDSLYAGWDPATTQPGATSKPARENMEPWSKFITLAARGEKTFVFAHSHVPTPYANTAATAAWIVEQTDAPRIDIKRGDTPAADDPRYPLVYRADVGRLHVWGYAGIDAQAHMTSVRHMADLWMAMDACGDGR